MNTESKRYSKLRTKILFPIRGMCIFLGVLWLFCATPIFAASSMPTAKGLALHPANPTAARTGSSTILLIHGFDNIDGFDNHDGFNCNSYWGDVKNYLGQTHDNLRWLQDFRTIGFYAGDNNCNVYLHDGSISNHCGSYYPDGSASSENGTTNESIYHLSCLLAWYIYDTFGVHAGWNIEIVAHSMGGLLIRNAIYQVQQSKATWAFPPTLGGISDVITFETPHAGVTGLGAFACNACRQADEMSIGSSFMNEMINNATNPHATTGTLTDWTLMGSECDFVIPAYSAVGMNNAGHKIVYAKAYIAGTNRIVSSCYTHFDILNYSDGTQPINSDAWDANQYYCDRFSSGSACDNNYNSNYYTSSGVRAMHDMFYALWYDTW